MTNWARSGFVGRYGLIYLGSPNCPSANTKGSWVTVTSGEDYDIHGLMMLHYTQTYPADFLTDFGIGSTPDIIINNVLSCGTNNDIRAGDECVLPIFIPKDTEIQVRAQSDYSGSNGQSMRVFAFGSCAWNRQSYQRVYTYGANTGDSGGQLVDPGGTANTYGSWVEFSAALPQNIKAIMIAHASRGDHAITTNTEWIYDVGMGASTFEQVVIEEWHTGGEASTARSFPAFSPVFPISIPSGERLVVRAKCTVTSADRYRDIALYCWA